MKKCTARCWLGPLVGGKPSLVADGVATGTKLIATPGMIMTDADAATYDPTSFANFFATATLVEGKVCERGGSIRQHMEVTAQ